MTDNTPPQLQTEPFVDALAFCLAYEANGDAPTPEQVTERRPDAAWAVGQGADQDLRPERQTQTVALVSGGATKIKGYVFESAKLPEIRGASSLLDRINLTDLPRLWTELGSPQRSGDGLPACVIYANGGEILAFAPPCRAQTLADAVERCYARETLVAQSVAVSREFTLAQMRGGLAAGQNVDAHAVEALLGVDPTADGQGSTFGSLAAPLALAKYRRREGNGEPGRDGRALPCFETLPFARRCDSCDRRMAVTRVPAGEDERSLCEPCARKRIFGQFTRGGEPAIRWWQKTGLTWQPGTENVFSWVDEYEAWLGRRGEALSPSDLDEIAQASEPPGFVGVVYADGNNMGALLETLDTPAKYAGFARNVYEATRASVFQAVKKHLPPTEVRDSHGERKRIHPFEILSIGGDDLFLIVPAHAALPIACEIAEGVEDTLLKKDAEQFEARDTGSQAIPYRWEQVHRCRNDRQAGPAGTAGRQCTVSMSVGVVLAPQHTPVFYLQEFAAALLKSAKVRAKALKKSAAYYGGTVDFQSLKSSAMLADTIGAFRKAALTVPHGRLYARPYTVAEMRTLLETIETLKAADFPRGQAYRLRESLREGRARSTVDYLYYLSRSRETRATRERIEALWRPSEASVPHPWRDGDGGRETIWTDIVELYDFVPLKENNHAATDTQSDPDV